MKCVYTTNHDIFLRYMLARRAMENAWFFSNRRWKTASTLVNEQAFVPIFIRELNDEDSTPLRCSYQAELTEVVLSEHFVSKGKLKAWITPKLEFQRAAYKFAGFPPDEIEERVESELEGFADASTIYAINSLKRRSIPITELLRDRDRKPLSGRYAYSYALCWYAA